MSSITLEIIDSWEIYPYIDDLHELEQHMVYPVDESDNFIISHGSHYHPFFSDLGAAKFLLLKEKSKVQGILAGVWRTIDIQQQQARALYLGDLKLAPHLRGKNLVVNMIWHGIKQLFKRADLGTWSVVYGVAMRGEKGDVLRSMDQPLHPSKWLDYHAQFNLYFVPPTQLLELPDNSPAPKPSPHVNFSPDRAQSLFTTRGTKDFILQSTNAPWSLVHLDLASQPSLALHEALKSGAQDAVHSQPADALACFAIDKKRRDQIDWLANHGISSTSTCTLYAMQVHNRWMSPQNPLLQQMHHAYLATSTI